MLFKSKMTGMLYPGFAYDKDVIFNIIDNFNLWRAKQ